ncbi:glycoside hydrolase family 3 protein [Desarmillaria ectypa]|nr:glycoside hydrolase family 3 protein [Desarmillaria ectypa]
MERLRLFVTLVFSSLVTLVVTQQQDRGSPCVMLSDEYLPSSSTSTAASTSTATTTSMSSASIPKVSYKKKVDLATFSRCQTDKIMLGNCVGNTPAIPSISFPGLCVRFANKVSAFPAAINAAATFNRTLIRQRSVAIGQGFRGRGMHVALGPMMNIMRATAAGRNWEGFGGDPYLSGEGAYETVMGLQSTGVQATEKHFINDEQEHFRYTSSSEADDSYINGRFACQNDKTLNGMLKTKLGFPGYWQAKLSTGSINLGLDMTMPGNTPSDSEISAVNQVTVPETRVDDMETRILAAWYLLGQYSGYPDVNFDAWDINAPVNTHVDVQSDHKNLIRAIGQASTVLLKNSQRALPLGAPRTLAIMGSGARNSTLGPNGYTDRLGNYGVLAMGWGSGTTEFPYLVAPLDALTAKASADGTKASPSTSDTDLDAAANAAAGKDVVIVFITADSGEGSDPVEGQQQTYWCVSSALTYPKGHFGDRNDLLAWHGGDALVQKIVSVNPNTIVAVNSVGPMTMEDWIDNENVKVWSGLTGQEAVNAVTDVLYGVYNPSASDYPAAVIYSNSSLILDIPYKEGLFIDYRHFDAQEIKPRFEFGFWLSYTTFEYSHLSVSGSTAGNIPTGAGSSIHPSLHESVAKVIFTLKNAGKVAGHEIPQLYISLPPSENSPPQGLKGFDSIYLEPGESTRVTIELSRYSFVIWDVKAQKWSIPSGTSKISVGSSSRNIRLTGTLAL